MQHGAWRRTIVGPPDAPLLSAVVHAATVGEAGRQRTSLGVAARVSEISLCGISWGLDLYR